MNRLADELRVDIQMASEQVGQPRWAPLSLALVILYRLSTRAHYRGHPMIALALHALSQLLTGADVNPQAQLGPGLFFHHTAGVVIGNEVTSEGHLTMFGGATLGLREKTGRGWGYPQLGRNVAVFAKASVIGPVKIGDNVRIGAHALVLDDIPDDSSVRGPAPAKPDITPVDS